MTMATKKLTKKTKATKPREASSASVVAVPYAPTTKYAQQSIHMDLSLEHATHLRAVLEGLELEHAKLSSGRLVQTTQDAIRWLIEAVAA